MKYDFDKIIDRRGTDAIKIEAMPEGTPADALSAWVADMDFACAPEILKALHDRLDRQILGYTMYGSENYKAAVTGWFDRRFGWKIDPKHMVFSPGIVTALGVLVDVISEEGDNVVIQRPVYYPFTNKIEGNGRKVVTNSLKLTEKGYEMDFDDLDEKMADPKTKAMILCSPHNPVGRVWTKDELKAVIDICKKHDKWLVCDEIHCDLTRVGVEQTPIMKLMDELAAEDASYGEYKEKMAACTAPTKTFNLAGLLVSNIIIPGHELRKRWYETADGKLSLFSNVMGLVGAETAYNNGEEWLDQLRKYLDENLAYVAEFLARELPEAKLIECQGTYLAWIDFRAYCSDAKVLEEAMQKHGKIALDEGYIFGEEGCGFERLNVAMPRSMVEDAMARMKTAVEWIVSKEKDN